MLGHSNAGKTTYMALMYRLMNRGFKGFKITADDRAQHEELLGNARAVREGRYPPPTSRRSRYDFTLTYWGRRISEFTWEDYRGGALSDRSSEEDVASLMEALTRADAVIVFVDAHALATGSGSGRAARRLTTLVQRAIEREDGAIPLVLGYTKADLLTDDSQWKPVLEPFAALSDAMDRSGNVVPTTVAVACGPRPRAVHVPVLWCLSHHVSERADRLEASVEWHKRTAKEAEKNATLWNSITSAWNGVESENKRRIRHLKEAESRLAELKPIRRPARRLARALEKAQRKDAPPSVLVPSGGR